jgi:alpha-L-rhamnosidase
MRTSGGYSDHNALASIDDDIADTAQCAYVSLLLAKMGDAVGNNEVVDRYSKIYESYKSAWQGAFINEDGTIGEWQQSLYTIGLAFGLYSDEMADKGASYLNAAVVANDYHLNTGYIATQFLLPVLCDYGYTETAYKVLMQDTYPSWNKMISYGNTTITEGWNTIYDNNDGTYGINGSLNHMALGSVGQWIYEYMLGIRRDDAFPAFKHFYLEPVINTEIGYAQGSYKSMYGYIESGWKIEGNNVLYNFVIPPNTSATVSLGVSDYNNMELAAGTYEFTIPIE